jgi:hypothetical protein
MHKFMDVNPFKKQNEEMSESGAEMPKESRMGKLRSMRPKSGAGWLALVLALALVWMVGVSYGVLPSTTFPATSSGTYQAVFLTNGQVYFGKLREANREYLVLEDIYYLQVSQRLQPAEGEPGTDITLVKLGNELHGPEDIMYVPKGQVIFWENMKADSAVVQVINQLKEQQAQQ